MKIGKVELTHIKLNIKRPFSTGCGVVRDRHLIIVKTYADGLVGWGEVSSNVDPIYSYETTGTCIHILRDFLIPSVLNVEISDAEQLMKKIEFCRGHNMAKAGLEMAFWDMFSKSQELPLYQAMGGESKKIGTGVSVGIEEKVEDLLEGIRNFIKLGYQRIKVKIKPGWDIQIIKKIRDEFGMIQLMADANSSYNLKDIAIFKRLDDFDLMMIEQPLDYDDIIDHSKLQRQIRTPLCLDESIHGVDDARKAIELGSCRIINIKIARTGGIWEAKRIHDLCLVNNVPVWCGSMIQSGLGEAFNIAISTLKNYCIPGDVAPSDRYFDDDIIEPFIKLNPDGTIDVPLKPGLGFEINEKKLNKYTVEKMEIS